MSKRFSTSKMLRVLLRVHLICAGSLKMSGGLDGNRKQPVTCDNVELKHCIAIKSVRVIWSSYLLFILPTIQPRFEVYPLYLLTLPVHPSCVSLTLCVVSPPRWNVLYPLHTVSLFFSVVSVSPPPTHLSLCSNKSINAREVLGVLSTTHLIWNIT